LFGLLETNKQILIASFNQEVRGPEDFSQLKSVANVFSVKRNTCTLVIGKFPTVRISWEIWHRILLCLDGYKQTNK